MDCYCQRYQPAHHIKIDKQSNTLFDQNKPNQMIHIATSNVHVYQDLFFNSKTIKQEQKIITWDVQECDFQLQ